MFNNHISDNIPIPTSGTPQEKESGDMKFNLEKFNHSFFFSFIYEYNTDPSNSCFSFCVETFKQDYIWTGGHVELVGSSDLFSWLDGANYYFLGMSTGPASFPSLSITLNNIKIGFKKMAGGALTKGNSHLPALPRSDIFGKTAI
jgi:hypothetical protein